MGMDEKRLEILERATNVYMRLGIKSVTMDDLARELGISKKTIYKYFDDKSDLVRSIVQMKTEMDQAICMNCINQNGNAIDDLIQVSKLIAEIIGRSYVASIDTLFNSDIFPWPKFTLQAI